MRELGKLGVYLLIALLVISSMVLPMEAHVEEDQGEALQMYSVYTENEPTINGDIATANVQEWEDAYVRNMTLNEIGGSHGLYCTLLFKNNDTTLFVGVVFTDTSALSTDYVTLFFDEGNNASGSAPVDGDHDDTLSNFNENAVYLRSDATQVDMYWQNGWVADSTNFTASERNFGGVYNFEFAIPLDEGVDSSTSSDLNVGPYDEIGLYLEVWDSSNSRRYVIAETNGWNASLGAPELPSLGNGWVDLQLGEDMDRTVKSQYAINGDPDMNDGIPISGDQAWTAVEEEEIALTDYNGNIIEAVLYTMERDDNLYHAVKVYDDDQNDNDHFMIYQDDSGGGGRDYELRSGTENAVYMDGAGNYRDMTYSQGWIPLDYFWGDDQNWRTASYDISFVTGRPNILIMFDFRSDNNNNDDGWYIDDISITGDAGTAHSENFDGATHTYTLTNEFEVGTPALGEGPGSVPSNPNCAGTDLDNNYNNNARSTLTSPSIDLSGYTSATLSFDHWRDLINWGGGANDYGIVMLYSPQGIWVDDNTVGDGTDGDGNGYYFDQPHSADDRYEFEFEIPFTEGNWDLRADSNDDLGFMLEFFDADTNSRYYWDQTSNETSLITDANIPRVSTAGWATLETGYPWIQITSPTNGTEVSGMPNVQMTAIDNQGTYNVDYVSVSVDDGTWNSAMPAASQYSWFYNWNTLNVTEGWHTLKAYAEDDDDNVWTTEEIDVVVDNYMPTLQIVTPTSGSVLSGTAGLSVNASEINGQIPTDGNPMFSVDGGGWRNMTGTGPYTFQWSTSEVLDGSHTLVFAVRDEAYNYVTQSVQIVVDNTDPWCAVVHPLDDQYVEGTTDIKVFAQDNIGVGGVNISLDGGSPVPLSSSQGGYYTFTIDTSMLENGDHTIDCSCSDYGGNTATGETVTMMVDNEDPVLSIVTPTTLYVEGTEDLTVDVQEDYLDELTYRVDGGPWFLIEEEAGAYIVDWDTTQLTDGQHTVYVRAVDMLGHETVISSDFIVDNTDPSLQITSPEEGEYVEGLHKFTAVSSDAVGLSSVVLEIDDTEYTMLQGENYFFSLATGSLEDGTYMANVTATDLAGHETAVEVEFHVDNNAPTVSFSSPEDGDHIEGDVTIDATCDDVFLDTCQFRVDEDAWMDIGTLNTTGYRDGDHTITVRGADMSGKMTDIVTPVVMDNTPPRIVSHYPKDGMYMEDNETLYVQVVEEVGVDTMTYTVGAQELEGNYNPMNGLYEAVLDTSTFEDGEVDVTMTVTDEIGHVTELVVTVHIDNTEPHLDPIDPIEGSHVAGEIDLSTDATDIVEYSVDGGPWTPVDEPLDTTELNDGEHTVTLRARDDAGHVTTVDMVITVDNTAPVVSFVSPVPMEHITGIDDFELSIDEDNIATIDVEVSDLVLSVPYEDPYWGLIDTTNLSDGENTITAEVTDMAGHSTVAELVVFVDNSAPAVETNYKDGKSFEGDMDLKLTVTDDTSVESVMVRIDQGDWKEAVYKDGDVYRFSWPTDENKNGDHTYQVRTTDTLGNTETTTYKVEVQNPQYSLLMWGILIALIVGAIVLLLRKGKGDDEMMDEDFDMPGDTLDSDLDSELDDDLGLEEPEEPEEPGEPKVDTSPMGDTTGGTASESSAQAGTTDQNPPQEEAPSGAPEGEEMHNLRDKKMEEEMAAGDYESA